MKNELVANTKKLFKWKNNFLSRIQMDKMSKLTILLSKQPVKPGRWK